MFPVAASPLKYRKLVSEVDWTWYNDECKDDSEMQTWDTSLQTLLEGNLKPLEGGGELFPSLNCLTTTTLQINKKILNDIFLINETIMKKAGVSKKKKKKNKEIIVDVLGDEYTKLSSKMFEFLSELERFIMLARDSHSYIADVIQRYFKMEVDKRDAEFYKLIEDKLKKLIERSDIYELSAHTLLKKAEDLLSQYEDMLTKLNAEIQKLDKKEKKARFWKRVTCTIFVCAAVGLAIATIVTTVMVCPLAAPAIGVIAPIAKAGHWVVNMLEETEKQCQDMRKQYKDRRETTRVAITELGHIKFSINSVKNKIGSLLNKPSTEMDQEDIHSCMKKIKGELSELLNMIDDLDKDLKKLKKEMREGRENVLVMQKN